ncbi:O-antigen ligase family protein [Priestia sp. SB1]|uniref:O-antigen ligase family protein n=1 Tax=Priestia sp. SB1 TaxID=3132359 RepID=UPI00316EB4F6
MINKVALSEGYQGLLIKNLNYEKKIIGLVCSLMVLLCVFGTINYKIYFGFIIGVLGIFIIVNDKLYKALLFLMIFLYIILNYGVTNVGVNVGGILIPIAEVVLLIGLIRLLKQIVKGFKPQINYKFVIVPIVLIFMGFLFKIPADFHKYGQIAFRDATSHIEILYFIVVINEMYGLNKEKVDKYLLKFLLITLNILFFYSFFYLKKDLLLNISPVYEGFQKTIYLLGNFNSTHFWLLFLIIVNMTIISNKNNKGNNAIVLILHFQNILSSALIFITTSRITILTYLFFILLFLLINKKKYAFYLINYLIILLISLYVLLLLKVKIESRRGIIDFNFLSHMFLSMFGGGDIQSMSSGVDQRKTWYKSVLDNSFNIRSFFLGRGFGIPLIEFYDPQGFLVREPHNSMLSIYARMGIFGLMTWLTLILCTIKVGLSKIKNNNYGLLLLALVIMGFFNSLVEPYFELPYNEVPFFCLLAILYKGTIETAKE